MLGTAIIIPDYIITSLRTGMRGGGGGGGGGSPLYYYSMKGRGSLGGFDHMKTLIKSKYIHPQSCINLPIIL